jgi:hypothetical protein
MAQEIVAQQDHRTDGPDEQTAIKPRTRDGSAAYFSSPDKITNRNTRRRSKAGRVQNRICSNNHAVTGSSV